MLKYLLNLIYLFSLALLLLSPKAEAQQYPSPATRIPYVSLDSPANFTRADTARAIRRLFRSRRGGGIGWLALGTSSILASTLPAQQSTSAGVWTPGVVAGSAFMLIGLNKRIQFRPGQEQQILRELAATGRLAPTVARRLRGKFKVTKGIDSDYNPLLAEGIAPASAPTMAKTAQVPVAPPSIVPSQSDTTQVRVAALPQQFGTSTPSVLAQEIAYSDTLRAISRLFERRRRGAGVWAGGGLSSALVLAVSLASPNADAGSVSGGSLAVLLGGFVVAPVAIGIANFSAYNPQRQQEVERNYRAGQPLPKKLRDRLKKKDLQPYD